jgi:hypothetical protein
MRPRFERECLFKSEYHPAGGLVLLGALDNLMLATGKIAALKVPGDLVNTQPVCHALLPLTDGFAQFGIGAITMPQGQALLASDRRCEITSASAMWQRRYRSSCRVATS